jgi:hypothetical protein
MSISETVPQQQRTAVAGASTVAGVVRARWTVFLVLFGIALTFAVCTQHVWEDFYITYRASKNLAIGNGLTFTAGERVHSFTSPLGTLLPTLASLMTGNTSDTAALWIFRFMSIAAYGGAGIVLWQLARRFSAHVYPAVFLVALLATDAKTVDFTISGMETPYLLLFLGWNLYALFFSPPRRAVHLGLAWAGLMWSRPDSFIYIGALALGTLLFGRYDSFWAGRRDFLKDCLVGGVITTALYGPWLAWAWWYYGTPIPHTVIAKGLLMPHPTVANVLTWLKDFPFRVFGHRASLGLTFMPPYGLNSGWPMWQIWISTYLSLGVMLLWLVPLVRWESRVASFAFTIGYFYLNYFANFPAPWYIPTLTTLAFVALAAVVSQWVGAAPANGGWRPRWYVLLPTMLVPLGALLLLLATGLQMGLTQRINENGNRRLMAEWLRDHAATPKDTVFIECLGYVGFFSNLKIYDWPGLCSPEVVAVRRKSTTLGDYTHYFPEIISALQPDWVVLRSSEIYQVNLIDRDLLTRYYSRVKVFDCRERIDAIKFLPGRGHLLFDSHFEVYHRNAIPIGETGLQEHIPVRTVPITVESLVEKRTWAGPAYNSKGYIAAHAPSFLTVRVPAGAKSIVGQFGFFPGSYERPPNATAGAIVTINIVAKDGTKTQAYMAALNPAEREKDRGDQNFVAPITVPDPMTAELVIEPPPGRSNAFGWTYWTNLKFEIPRQ